MSSIGKIDSRQQNGSGCQCRYSTNNINWHRCNLLLYRVFHLLLWPSFGPTSEEEANMKVTNQYLTFYQRWPQLYNYIADLNKMDNNTFKHISTHTTITSKIDIFTYNNIKFQKPYVLSSYCLPILSLCRVILSFVSWLDSLELSILFLGYGTGVAGTSGWAELVITCLHSAGNSCGSTPRWG